MTQTETTQEPTSPKVTIRLPRGVWFFDSSRQLGPAGGFGEVFEGWDSSNQPVAIKRLKLTVGEAAHRELRIADELVGKSFDLVLPILDCGEDAEGGGYYVVMPRAERSLEAELGARGGLPAEEAIEVLEQLAEGIRQLSDIVHRDLKPGNVLLHEGRWKIADFGLARFVEAATSSNTVRGFLSAPYAAPEQWLGEHATPATDVYALSCIGYELLRGTPPFLGPTKADFYRQHTTEAPPALTDVDPRVRAILSAGLRKPQAGRPPIERILAVLRAVRAGGPREGAGVEALRRANATESERVTEAQSEAERRLRAAGERQKLVDAGKASMLEIMGALKVLAQRDATECGLEESRAKSLTVTLGKARLHIEFEGSVPPGVLFGGSKWDVLAIGGIVVSQGHLPTWTHGATLWYMRRQANGAYRWHEVSYRRNAFTAGESIGPFQIQAIGDDIYKHADLAAAPGMHTIEVDFGPTPIDDEDTAIFVERWIERLARAYDGRLRPF
jgi:serine/threonine-protein kinase